MNKNHGVYRNAHGGASQHHCRDSGEGSFGVIGMGGGSKGMRQP